jgi:hypothetical protein
MPYTITYNKSTTYSIANAANGFSRTVTSAVTSTGNERRIISENIPSGAQNSGLIFNFNTGSGLFLGFSSNSLPIIVSGEGWNYSITLSGHNNFTSFFARTGVGVGYENTEGLNIQNTNGTLYVTNPGNTLRVLTVETLTDVSPGWGS